MNNGKKTNRQNSEKHMQSRNIYTLITQWLIYFTTREKREGNEK